MKILTTPLSFTVKHSFTGVIALISHPSILFIGEFSFVQLKQFMHSSVTMSNFWTIGGSV